MCYNFVLYIATLVSYSYSMSLYNKYVIMFGYIKRLLLYILHLFVSIIFFLLILDLFFDALNFFFLSLLYVTIVAFHVGRVLFFAFVENWIPETFKPYIHSVCIKLDEFKLYTFKKVTMFSYYIGVFLTHDSFIHIRIICKCLLISFYFSHPIVDILIPAIKLHYTVYHLFWY